MLRNLFFIALAIFALFEIANVYFIMPFPGSQRTDSIDLAYGLYHYRWMIRLLLGALILAGALPAWRWSKRLSAVSFLIVAGLTAFINGTMTADHMFLQTKNLTVVSPEANKVSGDKLVLGVAMNGQARAYPIQFMGYHHQVQDTIAGQPILVTYCTVCRTGRVFSPVVQGRPEQFRLVGMDHFNAMLEDRQTGSWWRQATGEAIAGPLKGQKLEEVPSLQTSLQAWLKLYPDSRIMQSDTLFKEEYADLATYDIGLGRGQLTGTDTASWNDKSWVVGIEISKKASTAFDWNRLKKERIINAVVGGTPVLLALGSDDKSFFACLRPDEQSVFSLENDSIKMMNKAWNLLGEPATPGTEALKRVNAHQEFWHSWRTFHPYTTKY